MPCKLSHTYKYKLRLWKWKLELYSAPRPPRTGHNAVLSREECLHVCEFDFNVLFTMKISSLSWSVRVLHYAHYKLDFLSSSAGLSSACLQNAGIPQGSVHTSASSLCALFSGGLLQPSASHTVSMPRVPQVHPQPWPSRCLHPTPNMSPPLRLLTGVSKLNRKFKMPDFHPHSCLPVHPSLILLIVMSSSFTVSFISPIWPISSLLDLVDLQVTAWVYPLFSTPTPITQDESSIVSCLIPSLGL